MAEYPTISLCMIARDEEHCMEQALESVKPIVDEIILFDTGSVDSTMEIAKRYGAKIFQEEWANDFSLHRNHSLKEATCDWILVLDADEVIDARQHEIVRKLTLRENNCFLLTQRHYTDDHRLSGFTPCAGEYPHWERNHIGYFESSLCRLFPNDERITYRGQVHELVEHSIGEHEDLILVQSPVRLHHYGNTAEIKQQKKKGRLYTPLGQQKVEEQPGTWKAFYELGVEHNCNGRREESAEAFEKAVELNPEYVPSWVNYGYVLVELARYEKALEVLSKALEIDPKCAEAHCNLGVMYMRRQNYHFAVSHLQKAIEFKNDYLNAYTNLGVSLMKLGDVQGATKIFQSGYDLAPSNGPLLTQFGFCLYEKGIIEEACMVLRQAVKLSPKDPGAWLALGKTLESLSLPTEAKLAFDKVSEIQRQAQS